MPHRTVYDAFSLSGTAMPLHSGHVMAFGSHPELVGSIENVGSVVMAEMETLDEVGGALVEVTGTKAV